MPSTALETAGRSTRVPPARALPAPAAEPVYVEVSSLLNRNLTGIGRFAARLVEALAWRVPVRLVTFIGAEQARSINLRTSFLAGQEMTVTAAELPPADEDVGQWVRRLLSRPRHRHDARAAGRYPGIYTLLRPPGRHFRREIGLLYDFTPLLLPWAHLPGTREHFGIFFAEASGWCDKGLAISHSTKADAAWLCALPPDAVAVGYPGPSLCVRAHAEPGSVERRPDVLLVVSTLEPRKNGALLLEWFLQTAALPAGMELWWVGPEGWLHDPGRLRRRGARGRQVHFLGMVSDRRLCALYRQAAFTIYPSLYEGFGFPVLDSLWHGTPVLTSCNSSLQEFTGPGVFFFDACDPASLDAAYRELQAAGPVPIDREPLATQFSWDALARTVLGLCA